jgi:hypothetical protein
MGRERWTSRLTVEESPIHLSTAALCSIDAFRLSAGTRMAVSWPLSNGSNLGSLGFEIRDDWRGPHLYLCPQVIARGETPLMGNGQLIRLTTTRPNFGGKRFWFKCDCGRRSGRLYLPTGETVFRCRQCYNLTYQSAQEHDTRAAKDRELLEYYWQAMASAEARARNPRPPS